MAQQKYVATLSRESGKSTWNVIFRHPQPHESYGQPGHRVRRGLKTSDESAAQRMVDDLNEILGDASLWTPAAREIAQRRFAEPAVRAFYDVLAPLSTDFAAIREREVHLPTKVDGFAQVLLLGTYGSGKTTLLRQIIGTDPFRERFPSAAPSKTTTAEIEIVLQKGDFRGVVTFLPKEHVRAYVEDCVLAAISASVDGRDEREIARRLLEHRDQRFRLHYLLGSIPLDTDGELDDGNDDDDDGRDELGLDSGDTPEFPFQVPTYIGDIGTLGAAVARELSSTLGVSPDGAAGDERDSFEELLEEELRKRDPFHELVDRIMDDIESRLAFLNDGRTQARPDGWPSSFAFDCVDRRDFIARINRFSSNNGRLFGRLLTPLVQGMRVTGAFVPGFGDQRIPPLVLIDGEGFGHSSNAATSLPSEVMRRLDSVDAIVLVDNAAQPMQAGPGVILKALVTSGHEAKLRIAFAKFDLVRGGNLRTVPQRQDHVRASLDQAIGNVGKTLSRSAERTLQRALEGRVFYLSDIRKASDDLSQFTRAQLGILMDSLLSSIAPVAVSQSTPVYDEANLVLAVQRSMDQFHEAWRARLGLPSRAAVAKEHWARVKAMTRWISQLNQEGYDNLTPVADLEQAIRDRVYVFLENPVNWEPATEDPSARGLAVAAVCAELNKRLRDFSVRRLIQQRFHEWAEAYTQHRGWGSARTRARAVDTIYDAAAPVPAETPDAQGNEFLREIRLVVREAIQAGGGKLLNVVTA
jgi:hypothetical protein